MNKHDVVTRILGDATRRCGPAKRQGTGEAPANIALCKYWGKRDTELNLPVTSSLSVSLGTLGTRTTVQQAETTEDIVLLNGAPAAPDSDFARRLNAFLDLFREPGGPGWRVETVNTIPTAAGLASSASGFAALVLALDDWFGWALDGRSLSILARLGSGSASRSVFTGFVEWHAGEAADGMDSYAEPLDLSWPDFRIGLWTLSAEAKKIGSRDAMRRTVETSALYRAWPGQCAEDLPGLRSALSDRDIERTGALAERNALAMHATGLGAWPPVLFWLPETVAALRAVWALRDGGVPVYATMDAGPNVKVLFEANREADVLSAIPALTAVAPFG